MPKTAGTPATAASTPRAPKLAILLRTHRRHEYLPSIFKQFRRIWKSGIDLTVIISLDRPTNEVLNSVDGHDGYLSRTFIRVTPDAPVLGRFTENFLPLQNKMLEQVPIDTDWVFVCDDDFLLDVDGAANLRDQLLRTDVDAFFFHCLFIEDSYRTYNPAREHNSIRLYRHRPAARFSGKRMLSIPDDLHDEAVIQNRTAQYPGHLFEYGGFTEIDRLTTQTAYREAGKVDAFTAALTAPRSGLKPVPSELLSPLDTSGLGQILPRPRRSPNADRVAAERIRVDTNRSLFASSAASADITAVREWVGLMNVLASSRATCGPSAFGQIMQSHFDLGREQLQSRPALLEHALRNDNDDEIPF